ncbi:MAG: metallophosphoesterase family protein [Nitrospirota bacterium]
MKKEVRDKNSFTVGIISDTHGLLRPEAVYALQGADLIIHAGDIGKQSIMDELNNIAPIVAVRGNMDNENWAYKLKRTEIVEKNKILFCVIHDIGRLDLDPAAADINVVISGHSHRPAAGRHKGVLYINPGSAGPQRSTLPVSVALLQVKGNVLDAKIVKLKV